MRKWYWFLGLIGLFMVGCQENGDFGMAQHDRFLQPQTVAIALPTPPAIDPDFIIALLPPDGG